MQLLVDDAMPYWRELYSGLGKLRSFQVGQLNHEDLSNVEVLLIRSTTKVNKSLLERMPSLRFVGTATAGYDHLDIDSLNEAGVYWTNAAGCNANAVCQYVCCALLYAANKKGIVLKGKSLGLVGHGNVGRRIAKLASVFDMHVHIFDPPQKEQWSKTELVYADFEQVLKSDFICLHAPLNSHASYPTLHMFNDEVLRSLKSSQTIINAGRGELIDNRALLKILEADKNSKRSAPQLVLDVWENEPNPELALLPYLMLATPHIAGHSLDGKAYGTEILKDALLNWSNTKHDVASADVFSLLPSYEPKLPDELVEKLLDSSIEDVFELQSICHELCKIVYDIANDDSVFRSHMAQSTSFALLRQKYPIRREFSALRLNVANTKIQELLSGIGFIISNGS